MRALFLILLGVPSGTVAQATCPAGEWTSVGVAAYHCPGGTCTFTPASGVEPATFSFTAEPWLRGIDPAGPAAGLLDEGDVIIAVNDILITAPMGGRELARLDVSRDARITVRRGSRLVEVAVRPERSCGEPLMLVGNTVLQTAAAPETRPGTGSSDPLIDFTVPQRTGSTAVDIGLGMTLRCSGCEWSLDDGAVRWSVPAWPVVESVEDGGVAVEAGLRPGDEIRRVAGRDVRSTSGDSPIFGLPAGDFTIEYVRNGVAGTAAMNRRIHDVRVVRNVRTIRIVRRDKSWGNRLLGTFARVWHALVPSGESAPPGRIIARGDTWGPSPLGLMFRSNDESLFVLDRADGRPTIRFRSHPVVAEVVAGGPAERAGLAPGDVVEQVDGTSVLEPEGAQALFFARAGEALEITFVRDGRSRTTTLNPMEDR